MRVKYGKNKHSKVMGFSNILGKQKSTQFPKYVKSEFPYQGKNMGKHKHFKVKGFLNFSYEAEIQAVPKTQEKWISIVRKKRGKTQIC